MRLARAFAVLCLAGVASCQSEPNGNAEEAVANVAAAAKLAKAESRDANPEKRKTAMQAIKGCAVTGLSIEADPLGLNVRASASAKSPIVGVLHSLIETDPHDTKAPPVLGDKPIGPAFSITAISGEWLKIADIDAEIDGFDPETRRYAKRTNYQGSGWVHQSRVAIDPGFHDHAYGKPYFEPGDWRIAEEKAGELLTLTGGKQGETAKLLSCQRDWIEVSYRSRQGTSSTGWFKIGPHYTGKKFCEPDDVDCPARQNPDLWG